MLTEKVRYQLFERPIKLLIREFLSHEKLNSYTSMYRLAEKAPNSIDKKTIFYIPPRTGYFRINNILTKKDEIQKLEIWKLTTQIVKKNYMLPNHLISHFKKNKDKIIKNLNRFIPAIRKTFEEIKLSNSQFIPTLSLKLDLKLGTLYLKCVENDIQSSKRIGFSLQKIDTAEKDQII